MTAPPPDLSKLHDFYQPVPPAWTPHTVGWYVLFVIVGLLVLWMIIHTIRKWLANRYRREALRELAALPPDQFSALLKRAALAAWPREKVASLAGEKWLDFLSDSTGNDTFRDTPGNCLEEVALKRTSLSTDDEQKLRKIAAEWIRRHRVQA
jgi:hypothetical protein